MLKPALSLFLAALCGTAASDGEGSVAHPYYPSREPVCKPARGKDDRLDCVNLDGWTVDFLCARIPGSKMVAGERWRSRQGVGPIGMVLDMGAERGLKSMLATIIKNS